MRDSYLMVSLLISLISGSSKLLISCSLVLTGLVFLFEFISGLQKNLSIKVRIWSVFILVSAGSIFSMPPENRWKFVLAMVSVAFCFALIRRLCLLSCNARRRIILSILAVIFAGDLLHLSGLLGEGGEVYKSIVRFDLISNMEREKDNGILGLRYHGWFGEPSYHGVFTGLLCSALMRVGGRVLTAAIFGTLFVLCPSPTMILGFIMGYIFAGENFARGIARKKIGFMLAGSVGIFAITVFFADRVSSLMYAFLEVYSGGYVLNSEAVRLVYPLVSLTQHWAEFGFRAQSVLCVEVGGCAPEAMKFPLISYFIFFGATGLLSMLLLYSQIYRVSLTRAVAAIVLGSIVSGGGGFVVHFALIVGFLLGMSQLGKACT